MTTIIRPHVDNHGRFINKYDERFQLIGWTDTYTVEMCAYTAAGDEIREVRTGSYEMCRALFERNCNSYVTVIVRQIRVLGDGSTDTCATDYHIGSRFVSPGFEFNEVD